MSTTTVNVAYFLSDGSMLGSNFNANILKSTDYGVTWTTPPVPVSPQTINAYLQTSDGAIYAGTRGTGVFKSTNNGTSWSTKQNGLTGNDYGVYRLAENRSNGYIFAGTGYSIFRTTNGGTNWVKMFTDTSFTNDLMVDSSGNVWAATGKGAYKSTDNGATWSQFNNSLADTVVLSFTTAANGNVFAGTRRGVFRTTDGGTSWTFMDNGLKNVKVSSMSVKSGTEILAGTGAGPYRSTDNGASWMKLSNGFPPFRPSDIAFNKYGDVILGIGGSGTYKSTDNGSTWSGISGKAPYMPIVSWLLYPDGTLLAGTYYSGVWRSTDNGDSWTQTGLNDQAITGMVKNDGGTIFVSTGIGMYKSSDNGVTWDTSGLHNSYMNGLAIDSAGTLLGATNQGLHRSTDNGASWHQIIGAPGAFFIFPCVKVGNNGDILASTSYAPSDSAKGIYHSTDHGATWSHIPHPNENIFCFAVNSLGDFFGGSNGNVYKLHTIGDEWTDNSTGLDTIAQVNFLEFASNGVAFASTDKGLYRTTQSATSVRETRKGIPGAYHLGQNYPNPFNPTTNVDFQLSAPAYVTITLFNTLGQEIATLIDKRMTAGYYTATWNAGNAPSGVYFVRMNVTSQSGSEVYREIQKMTLIK